MILWCVYLYSNSNSKLVTAWIFNKMKLIPSKNKWANFFIRRTDLFFVKKFLHYISTFCCLKDAKSVFNKKQKTILKYFFHKVKYCRYMYNVVTVTSCYVTELFLLGSYISTKFECVNICLHNELFVQENILKIWIHFYFGNVNDAF